MVAETEQSIRRRILDATFAVVSRTGRRKLQLLEVAAEAGVSRPTVYRHFGSKEGLLEAFALYEQDNFNAGVAAATAGLRGRLFDECAALERLSVSDRRRVGCAGGALKTPA